MDDAVGYEAYVARAGEDAKDATVHGVPVAAPALPGRVMFDQHWAELAFLHWPVDPGDVASFFPRGVRPDVWRDGATYVGLVPFRMHRAGPGRRLPVPFFGSFLEWNVRLYSVDDQRRHGVVFRSLDCTRLAVVALARLVGVPYRYARISTTRDGDDVSWRMRRRGRPDPASRLDLRLGGPTIPTPLETFLTSRWGMHAGLGARTSWVPTEHGAWSFRSAELRGLDDELVAAAGVTPIGPMLRPLWTEGVHAQFAFPAVARLSSRERAEK